MPLPLSILDLAPLGDGQTSAEALAHSVALARHAEGLGYTRVWYAEHHSLPGVASTAPDLMIAYVGARTERIRLGAGGVMLPNHAPLRIAEVYRLLEAMYPGRVDLGLGRAPGTDGRTAMALRGDPKLVMRNDFPEQLDELYAWDRGRVPGVVAQPDDVRLPPIWLLGSSDFSARLAADRGYPYAFAAHFSPAPPEGAMRAYRDRFRPGVTTAPQSMLAVAAFVAETEEEAVDLARPALVAFTRLHTGRPVRPPTPEAARAYRFSPAEEAVAEQVRATQIVGTPESVATRIAALARASRADEVMVASHIVDHVGRLRSFELLMGAWSAT
ncbi:MAG: LLM class flavin-dependent oxidoreductase [Deltaproteobacteria bacterium]|nr:MAG: LLM class flavin-dependent oxidoreductase [Deltaproteobacteria bacterium]